MKTRFLAIGLAGISAALVACGGGSGPSGGPPPTTAPVATPTPYALGDAMTFSGSRTVAATFAYPSPSPYPSTTTTDGITQTVSVTAGISPAAPSTAGDFHTVETDAAALTTHTVTTDAWVGMSGSNLVEYAYNTVDDTKDSLGAVYSTPQVMDQFPETNAATWTNGPGVVYTEKAADGTNSTRTYTASGTYTETTTNSSLGINTTITENADGSGTINANGMYLGGAVNTIAFSAPSNNQVTVTVNYVQPPTPAPAPSGLPSPTPAPTIAPLVYTAPAWYGTGAPALYSQKTVVTSGVTYPASCNVPAAYGTSGNQLVQTTTKLDTIMGYTDTTTQTSYTNAQYGPVCVVISDVQDAYYDYQDDFATATGFHFHFPGTPMSTATTTQTLTLAAGATVHAVGRRSQSQHLTSISPARIAAAMAAITLRAERTRHAREMHIVRFMLSAGHKEIR